MSFFKNFPLKIGLDSSEGKKLLGVGRRTFKSFLSREQSGGKRGRRNILQIRNNSQITHSVARLGWMFVVELIRES